MGVRLPSEYQEIQYIEGTSADQYIDSGWLYTDDFEITAKIYFTGIEQTFYRDEFDGFYFRFMFASNVKARFDLGKTTGYAYYNSPADLPALQGDYRTYTIPFKAGEQVEIDVDGYRVSGSCANSAKKTITHKFAKNKHRLYGYQIVSESVLVRDFVPCYRKSDNKPGMYDLVTKQFFVNQGTGDDFLVGPDVIDSISPLMVAWRRMLMRKPPLDTSPKIAEYGKVLDRANTGVVNRSDGCYTERYEVQEYVDNNVIITNISNEVLPYQYERKNGVSGWWYGTNRTIGMITRIRFSLTNAQLTAKTSYAYSGVTGEVFFADRNSPYWGKKNIND